MEYSACREGGRKKNSESPTGIEPMTFRTPVGRSNHWATGSLVASKSASSAVESDCTAK